MGRGGKNRLDNPGQRQVQTVAGNYVSLPKGEYQCPRCGSHSAYESNVPIKKPGLLLGTTLPDSDVAIGGEAFSEYGTRTVTRCRDCNEILTETNYRRGVADIREAGWRKIRKKDSGWLALSTALMIFSITVFLFLLLCWLTGDMMTGTFAKVVTVLGVVFLGGLMLRVYLKTPSDKVKEQLAKINRPSTQP
mgnify:CR=1 FL=1